MALQCIPCRPFSPACLYLFVTVHAEYSLRRARISKVFNFLLAVATLEAIRAKGLITSQDSQIFNLVMTAVTAVSAVIADQGPVAKQEEVCIRVEKGTAGVAAEAINVPPVASCTSMLANEPSPCGLHCLPSSNALPSSNIYHTRGSQSQR